MAESLEDLRHYIGRSETANDVVTGSAMVKIAATLGLDNPAPNSGDPIPPGWYGAFFPASHRPSEMRPDGQASGRGIVPAVPLPRRRLGGVRMSFHEPLRIGAAPRWSWSSATASQTPADSQSSRSATWSF